MNVILENLRDAEIRESLARHHIPYTEALAEAIKARIQVKWLRDAPFLSVPDDSGLRTLTVDACVAAIKHDPEYARQFIPNKTEAANPPMGPPKISLRDQAGQRDNFTKIATGAVEVIDDRG